MGRFSIIETPRSTVADVAEIRNLEVKRDKKLPVDVKRRLDQILTVAIVERETFTEEKKRRVRVAALSELKKSDRVAERLREVEQAKAKFLHEISKLYEIGWDANGEPLKGQDAYQCGQDSITLHVHPVALEKGKKVAKEKTRYIEDAVKAIEAQMANVAKLKTKLWLADTYGDALTIMKAVLGDSDGIL